MVRQPRRQSAANWTLRRAPPKGFVASPEALQAIAGRYELFPGSSITVRPEGNRLVVEPPNGMNTTLIAESDSTFVVPQTGDVLEFVRDAQGNVTGASVDSQGAVIWAKRLP